jgi:alkylhydroperoxidase family enzyme
VLADWRTAPIDERLRATLGFLSRLTLEPAAVSADDARAVLDAGVSSEALADAVYVCFLWCVIDRVADALGVEALSEEEFERGAALIVREGY